MDNKALSQLEAEDFVTSVFRGVFRCEPDKGSFEDHVIALMNGASHSATINHFINSPRFGSKLFVPPGHFYSPIVDPDVINVYLETLKDLRVRRDIPDINLSGQVLLNFWSILLPYMASAPFDAQAVAPYRYRFDNNSYAWGDGSILHAMIRHFRPNRMIEIGSGWSSVCTLDTIDHFLDGQCDFTMIDPYADLVKSLIEPNRTNIRILDQSVQEIPLRTFMELERNDILFIDSTHVAKTGSDVCHEFFNILPRLRSGVVVHIHDVFWPFEYPESWIKEENRSWNELYLLRAFLTNNAGWDIIMMNDYMMSFEQQLISETYPKFLKNGGGAFWMQKK